MTNPVQTIKIIRNKRKMKYPEGVFKWKKKIKTVRNKSNSYQMSESLWNLKYSEGDELLEL